ncbi:MAG: hypothetical protein D6705_12590 [Deltaproteobacteria bacterium]|nr:MAG: hypothetical protein D6705_12590 [Deltaproteobacteria bacterium]
MSRKLPSRRSCLGKLPSRRSCLGGCPFPSGSYLPERVPLPEGRVSGEMPLPEGRVPLPEGRVSGRGDDLPESRASVGLG